MLISQVTSASDARSSATARLRVNDVEILDLNVSTLRIAVTASKTQSTLLYLHFVKLLLILRQRIKADTGPNLEPSTASRHVIFEPQRAAKSRRYKFTTFRQPIRACAEHATAVRLLRYN